MRVLPDFSDHCDALRSMQGKTTRQHGLVRVCEPVSVAPTRIVERALKGNGTDAMHCSKDTEDVQKSGKGVKGQRERPLISYVFRFVVRFSRVR